MSFRGVRCSGGPDPRDAALVARYAGSDWRFDVGWNKFELSLSLLVKFERPDWQRQQCYVYFEPFVEYLTQGRERAIVPYITERMSVRNMASVMLRRQACFAKGLAPVMSALGEKARNFLKPVRGASHEQVQGYHTWIASLR